MVNSNIALTNISIPTEKVQAFCQRNHITKLAFFGSVLRDDFTSTSDLDILFEYHPEHIPTYLKIAAWEIELTDLFNRQVDLRTPAELSKYFRQEVLNEAVICYDENR